jgi:formylglycine-generating enzyme required for sulfatase activity
MRWFALGAVAVLVGMFSSCERNSVEPCVPDCEGRVCGPDGCGHTCSPGCGYGVKCDDTNGQCIECLPQCEGKECGPDGCGGQCSPGCPEGFPCDDVNGLCESVITTDWVMVPAGSFTLGSPAGEVGKDVASDDEDLHKVTLNHDFVMLSEEVSREEFELLMGYDFSYNLNCGKQCPVDSVNYSEAAAFCNALSYAEGRPYCYRCQGAGLEVQCDLDPSYFSPYDCKGYRLPTEAEWEYAARAFTSTTTYNGNFDTGHLQCEHNNSVLDPIAWFCGNTGNREIQLSQPGGQLQPNAFGLHDMIGNVYEWTGDWYRGLYPDEVINPWVRAGIDVSALAVRGGAARNPPPAQRSAWRFLVPPEYKGEILGFRPVRTAACKPRCEGRECGPDLCNGLCGQGCEGGKTCSAAGRCITAPRGVWVTIPAGTFTMGSPPDELGRFDDEGEHQVTLTRSFEILSTEVTQNDFQTLMNYNPSYTTGCGLDCPVEMVNTHEAAAYCNALSVQKGLSPCYICTGERTEVNCSLDSNYATPYDCPGYRLPTEAEFEVAARAGTTSATYNGNLSWAYGACAQGDFVTDPIAWFCGNSGALGVGIPHPVGQKAPNDFGLYDMLGNVFEWTADFAAFYPTGSVTDPWVGPSQVQPPIMPVMRGGACDVWAFGNRAAWRYYADNMSPAYRDDDLGIRPVRTLP